MVLRDMLEQSYRMASEPDEKPESVQEYISRIPLDARPQFDALRALVKQTLPKAQEVLSYGVVGYKIDEKRARVFISGWKDHLAVYPIPQDKELQEKLKPYTKGKGTLWFDLKSPLPADLIKRVIVALTE